MLAIASPMALTGQTIVKASAGTASRGGIVTSTGDDVSVSFREESFGNTGGDDPAQGIAERPALLRQYSAQSDCFSVGGECDGFWGRQHDPASGMTYYLNEKVGLEDTHEGGKVVGRGRMSSQWQVYLCIPAFQTMLMSF